nr:MAG TPA: Putative HNHc nuclease [Caudoviricetes sp.]
MVEKFTFVKSPYGARLDKSLADALENLPIGRFNIYVTDVAYRTSSPQRKLFWMWMTELENWSGQPRKDWHDYFVGKFIPPDKHGISDISTKAMTHFMLQIQAECASEYGINLPLPEDNGYNEFVLENQYL